MPGLISTVLSELATTRTNTSPASGWLCLFKYLLTLSSMYVPRRVGCNSKQRQGRQFRMTSQSEIACWNLVGRTETNVLLAENLFSFLVLPELLRQLSQMKLEQRKKKKKESDQSFVTFHGNWVWTASCGVLTGLDSFPAVLTYPDGHMTS